MENESPFHRLLRELGDRIASAEAGEKLPPEPKLAREMRVSRSTLREAMRSFEARGLITRRQGAGTFVVDKNEVIRTGLEELESLETIAGRSGLNLSMQGLCIESFPAEPEYARIFNQRVGSRLISISRILSVDDKRAAYLQDIVPDGLFQESELTNDFKGSVLDLLIKRGDTQLDYSSTEIKVLPAPQNITRALATRREISLLMFEANLITKDGMVIDHSTSWFLPQFFHFHINRKISTY